MKKATIRPTAIPHSSLRLSRPDRATEEKRFTLPVSRLVTLANSESWGWGRDGRSLGRPHHLQLTGSSGQPITVPYHAVQVPVLVFRIPVDVQGQLDGTHSSEVGPEHTQDVGRLSPSDQPELACESPGQVPCPLTQLSHRPMPSGSSPQGQRGTTHRLEPGDLGGQAVGHAFVVEVQDVLHGAGALGYEERGRGSAP